MAMNNETMMLLERHFDAAFAAPDGIKKLRELILTLAMQGKLVPQDPNDEPASELLKAIEIQKYGNSKANKLLPEINLADMPYELPKGWKWVFLGEIGQTNIGLTYAPSDVSDTSTGTPVLRSNNIQNGKLDLTDLKRVVKAIKENVLVQQGDLLICARNGSKALVGKTAIITGLSEEMAFGAFMAIFRSQFNEYLLYFINSPLFRNMIDEVNTMTINQITQNNLKSTICPLPPLAEQRRIVVEIDRLMARCDELEKLKADRSQKLLTFHTAALDKLLKAKESSDFSTAWHFITQNFSELYSVKENVTELRKAILQLAVMGKLVPQDPNDEPASELLKAIELEKQRLVKEGKIKKSKPLPEIDREEIPYTLPNGWEFVRFGELATEIATGPFGLTIHKSDYIDNGIPLINPIHMVNGKIVHDPTVTVTHEKANQMESYRLFDGDIVMARRGEMGRCAIVTNYSNRWLCGTGSFVLRFVSNINRSYIITLFKSQGVKDYLGGNSVGTTMTNLNHGILNKMPIMLPPIVEQRRIVEKIDRLMALCDRLEESIEAAKGKQTDLLNALMSQV
jgi:type I restriction enzyme, S subunit